MKRSEMINLLTRPSVINENVCLHLFKEEAEAILKIIEDAGMLAPPYVNTEYGDHMNFYEINEWEKE